jgi:hypothetical protein
MRCLGKSWRRTRIGCINTEKDTDKQTNDLYNGHPEKGNNVVTKSSENGSKNMRAIPKGWRVGYNPPINGDVSRNSPLYLFDDGSWGKVLSNQPNQPKTTKKGKTI